MGQATFELVKERKGTGENIALGWSREAGEEVGSSF
jgi:hypothetical protein